MRFQSWENYIDAMLGEVKFRFDHKEIRAEYEEHMEDKLEFLMDCGMDEESAAREVLAEMGEPRSLGKVLNSIHNPLLGWVWRMSRIIAIAVAIALLVTGVKSAFSYIKVSLSDYPEVPTEGRELVYELEIDRTVRIGEQVIRLDRFERYEYELCVIKYTAGWSMLSRMKEDVITNFSGLAICRDDKGTEYHGALSDIPGRKVSKYISYVQLHPEADYMIIDTSHGDRELYISIPVRELPGNPQVEVSVR